MVNTVLGAKPILAEGRRFRAAAAHSGVDQWRIAGRERTVGGCRARVELDLPLEPRLEAIDEAHPDTVALLSGPLVLFPMVEKPPGVTRSQLLSVRKTGAQSWEAAAGRSGCCRLRQLATRPTAPI